MKQALAGLMTRGAAGLPRVIVQKSECRPCGNTHMALELQARMTAFLDTLVLPVVTAETMSSFFVAEVARRHPEEFILMFSCDMIS